MLISYSIIIFAERSEHSGRRGVPFLNNAISVAIVRFFASVIQEVAGFIYCKQARAGRKKNYWFCLRHIKITTQFLSRKLDDMAKMTS